MLYHTQKPQENADDVLLRTHVYRFVEWWNSTHEAGASLRTIHKMLQVKTSYASVQRAVNYLIDQGFLIRENADRLSLTRKEWIG